MNASVGRFFALRAACALLVAVVFTVRGQSVVANPPLIVRYDAESFARAPDGTLQAQPVGAEVDACAQGNIVARYDLARECFMC